ncbi:unnamed protein product [Orchesella dallaii]|uniref:Uncharacterized protein n=1 Tax=Orchesella dallaii TaxID=48710 RepID=A0ABP1RQW7_9HEXA
MGIGVVSMAQWFLCDRAETCAKFLNGMLDLETKLVTKKEKMGVSQVDIRPTRVLCKILVLIEAVTPIFTGIGSGLMPCSPPNLVVPFNPNCVAIQNEQKDTKSISNKCIEFIALATLNGIFFKAIAGCATALAIHVLVGCKSQCLALKMIEKRMEMNRRIQLLNILFNEAYVGTLFAFVGGCSCALTALSYALLRIFTSSLEFAVLVIIWLVLMAVDAAIVMLYICKLAGSVNSVSKNVLQKQLAALSRKRKDGLTRRVLKSCPPIKVSFGLCNFIDNETPLEFLEFSVNRLVDLILLK